MADDSIITYDAIYELLRAEKYKQELQRIDKDFYEKIARYIREKNISVESQRLKDSVFAPQSIKKTRKQIENAQKIAKDLYEKRESKIIQLALLSSRTDSPVKDEDALTDSEKTLFNEIKNILSDYRSSIAEAVIDGKNPGTSEPKGLNIEEGETEKSRTVRFVEAVPRFVDEKLMVHGPFEIGETASLPAQITEILIKNKKAEEV